MTDYLKVSELDSAASVESTDLLEISQDAGGGSYLSKKVTAEVLSSSLFGSASFSIDQTGGTSDTYGVLAGLVNGSNKRFTVSTGVYVSGSLKVYQNGQLQTQGTSQDWTETTPASGTFDFVTAPMTGDEITVAYKSADSTVGNADTLDGFEGSAFVQKAAADDITHSDASSWELKNSASNQDIDIQVNDGGTVRSAITVNGDEGSVTMPRQSYVQAYLTTTQVISSGSWQDVVFATEVTDRLGEYNPATGLFTAKDAGVYHIYCHIVWQNVNSGVDYYMGLGVNGSPTMYRLDRPGANTVYFTQNTAHNYYVGAGQTLGIKLYQSSGGNETIGASDGNTVVLFITKVS